MEIEPIVGPVGAGVISSVLTYLGVRTKTRSNLELEYMRRFDKALARAHEQDKRKDERIKALESRQDNHERQMLDLLREERESCAEQIATLRREFDERISSVTTAQPIGNE